MVRRRIELRLIEDRTSRLARFSKRRAGLLKKAHEIAVLCDAEVGVIIVSPLGKLSHFSSQASMENTIQRYQTCLQTGLSFRKHVCKQSHSKGFTCQKINSELVQVAQRLSDGGSTMKLSANELERLQEELTGALRRVRGRMMELFMNSIKELRGREAALLQEWRELKLALGKDADCEKEGFRETDKQNCPGRTSNGNTLKKSEGCDGSDDTLALRL